MPFFAIRYEVHFDDTMAYGSHHYLTNFKFQNMARETILFQADTDSGETWQQQLADIVLLTREAYSRNLAPVGLGETVAILLSYEDPSRSSVRLCFRVVGPGGRPVSCGFQTMVCMHRETGVLLPAPRMITQFVDSRSESSLLEELRDPSFAERMTSGRGLREVFPPEVLALANQLLAAPPARAYPKIVELSGREIPFPGLNAGVDTGPRQGPVLLFPGQGSYDREVLRELHQRAPGARPLFEHADRLTRQHLGQPFLPLVEADSQQHDRLLAAAPDLDQIGIFLSQVLIADLVQQRGTQPSLMVGHSFGELAALAAAGVFSAEAGLEIVCQRCLALRVHSAAGGMAALSCDEATARRLIAEAGTGELEVAVINHQKQTVLSGPIAQLERLLDPAAQGGVALTMLASRYPFHSSHTAGAVRPFLAFLRTASFSAARIPVFLGTERRYWDPDCDLAEILALQLVRRLDFETTAERLVADGYREFVECGAGEILTRLLPRALPGRDLTLRTAVPRGRSLWDGLGEAVALPRPGTAASPATDAVSPVPASATPAPSPAPPVVPAARAPEVATSPAAVPTPPTAAEEPIAIVAMGCVLPGARDPQQFWDNVTQGVSGIVDIAELDPHARADYMVEGLAQGEVEIVADKTYTLLNGTVLEIRFDEELLGGAYSLAEFDQLTRGQRLLSLALAQSLRAAASTGKLGSVQCILGGTADGSDELDDALFRDRSVAALAETGAPEAVRASLVSLLDETFGRGTVGDQGSLALQQHHVYGEVVERLLGRPVDTYIVDTACSSSLYAINLGAKALHAGRVDVVLAGGVFAPGPANNTLFAQFRGLTPRQSRPMDADADGVVFGDGAGVVMLKRLDDALRDGDKVLALIRATGLSSDGKSPSINVPQRKGQILAMRRAYRQARLSPSSMGYFEAHATATPVGDAVELASIGEVVADGGRPQSPIPVGSVKALIGHTGWVSGVASVIKVCKSFEHATIPRQFHYERPNPEVDLAALPLTIPTASLAWPETAEAPRRAGINSFGFGGTNAHMILESWVPRAAGEEGATTGRDRKREARGPLAVVALGRLFPADGDDRLESLEPSAAVEFERRLLRLPAKKLLLPDVTDHMDVSQYLAALAAEQILKALPEDWPSWRDEIGLVLGIESKTLRGAEANDRIFLDRLRREVREHGDYAGVANGQLQAATEALARQIRERVHPSGPYTLPGLMPNVTAGRAMHLFDLHGPNIVVDRGAGSLLQALRVASDLLWAEDCLLVMAGGINAYRAPGSADREGAVLLGLALPATARAKGLPVLARLSLDETFAAAARHDSAHEIEIRPQSGYRGASGGPELVRALADLGSAGSSFVLRLGAVAPAGRAAEEMSLLLLSPTTAAAATLSRPQSPPERAGVYDFVRDTPIGTYTPTLAAAPEPAAGRAIDLLGRRVLVVAERASIAAELAVCGALEGSTLATLCPADRGDGADYRADLSDDEALARSLDALPIDSFDAILAVMDGGEPSTPELLTADAGRQQTFLELLFAACRHAYPRLQKGEMSLTMLCTSSLEGGRLLPFTGLVSGFAKSLARELPEARCRVIACDLADPAAALDQAAGEPGELLTQGEVCFREGRRYLVQLRALEQLAESDEPWLDHSSVVVATGGGRGVTAVLAEELLERFQCTVIALGRTDLEGVPAAVLALDEAELRAYETDFYRQELARDARQKLPRLKQRFREIQSAHELQRVKAQMDAGPGRYEYHCADITDADAARRVIDAILERHGRVDLVLHGAGVQQSGALDRKSLAGFRRVVGTKVGGLRNLYRALAARGVANAARYHLLTSAFSVLGNDGQPDYGAANEAMNRLAATMDRRQPVGRWSTLAWLGWAGIGMTSGSEYAALAASRRLRGVSAREGREIFGALLAGRPTAAVNVLLAGGELEHYRPPITTAAALPEAGRLSVTARPATGESRRVFEWPLSLDNAPFLRDHIVGGTPTVPAAFITALVAQSVKEVRPDLYVESFRDTHFHRFARVPREGALTLRFCTEILEQTADDARIQVRILSDFVHKDGLVLRKDILHYETVVSLSSAVATAPEHLCAAPSRILQQLPDPYVMDGSIVSLGGPFDSMGPLSIGPESRSAAYQLRQGDYPPSLHGHLLPNLVMIDAFWRFGAIRLDTAGRLPVSVPVRCDSMRVFFDFTDFASPVLLAPLSFDGAHPRPHGELVHVGDIHVTTADGRLLLLVEDGYTSQPFGEVALRADARPQPTAS